MDKLVLQGNGVKALQSVGLRVLLLAVLCVATVSLVFGDVIESLPGEVPKNEQLDSSGYQDTIADSRVISEGVVIITSPVAEPPSGWQFKEYKNAGTHVDIAAMSISGFSAQPIIDAPLLIQVQGVFAEAALPSADQFPLQFEGNLLPPAGGIGTWAGHHWAMRVAKVPTEFEIQITAFIPEDHLDRPLSTTKAFGGDGVIAAPPALTGFTKGRTSYRLRQTITVIPSSKLSATGEKAGSRSHGVGTTDEYDKPSSLPGTPPTLTAAAKADAVLHDGFRKIDSATATPSTNTVTVTRPATNEVEVHFVMSANNPLFTGSPAIDWDITVTIDDSGNYEVTGDHDGYPAYDIYINATQAYTYDPRATGTGPGALFPPLDIAIPFTVGVAP